MTNQGDARGVTRPGPGSLQVLTVVLAVLALPGFWGCADDLPAAADDDEDGDDDAATDDDDSLADDDDNGDDDSTGDDDSNTDAFPCNGGTDWGMIPLAERPQFLYVDPSGSLSGNGTIGDPIQTIDAAIAVAAQGGDPVLIALSEDVHQTNVVLDSSTADLWIFGCAPETTTVVPVDADAPVIGVRDTDGVRLGAMTIEGGAYGVVVAESAGRDAPIQLEDLVITAASDVGLVVDGTTGAGTAADLERVVVGGTTPGSGDRGWGVAVQEAALVAADLVISDVREIGLFGHLADVTVENGTVAAVASASDGTLGRGVHLQLLCSGALRQVEIEDTRDAGVFLAAPQDVILGSVSVHGVGEAAIPGSQDGSGDGIVASASDLGFDPTLMAVTIDSCAVDTTDRAGIVLDGTAVEVDSNTVTNSVFMPGGWGIVSQNGAVVTGTDGAYDLDAGPGDALDLNTGLLDWVSVALQ